MSGKVCSKTMKLHKKILSLTVAVAALTATPSVAYGQDATTEQSSTSLESVASSTLPTKEPSATGEDAKKDVSFRFTPIDDDVKEDIFKNRPGSTGESSKKKDSESSSTKKTSTSKTTKTTETRRDGTRTRTTVTVTVKAEPSDEDLIYPPEWDGYVDDEISGVEGVDTGSGVDLLSLDLGEASDAAKEAVKRAYEQLGTPYVWGGTKLSDPHTANGGMDCSGLTQGIYAQSGVSIPRVTYQQINTGVAVPVAQIQPGDLVFYNNTGHVAIYVGNGEVIHAPQTGDVVKVSPLNMMPVEAIKRVA